MVLTSEEKGKGRATSLSWLDQRADVWEQLDRHKTVVSATVGSLTSTALSYPMDVIKGRLQTTRGPAPSIYYLTGQILREEGFGALWRGALIPLVSIAVVRTTSFSIYTASRAELARRNTFGSDAVGLWTASFVAGCGTGSILSAGSTPFELIKVYRQLEFVIAKEQGIINPEPMTARKCVATLVKSRGPLALYTGWKPHFIRDTFGTGLYFAEYDLMRQLLGRRPDGTQGPTPAWSPIPASLTPLFSGALAGASALALVYPSDAIKTNMQKRALSNQSYRSISQTFTVLVRGSDPLNPQPLARGIARLYRGLGVSAGRSCFTHGLLWLVVDNVQVFIERHRVASAAAEA